MKTNKAFMVLTMMALPHVPTKSTAATQLFLGLEYRTVPSPGTPDARGTIPAAEVAFSDFLGTAMLTTSDLSTSVGTSPKAVWGVAAADPTPGTSPGVASYSMSIGGTVVPVTIDSWTTGPNGVASTGATLDGFQLNGTTMQGGSTRPGFASGAGSGYSIATQNGGTDGRRNAVKFNFSNFDGGGIFAFGIFGGDLETGGPGGSPVGLLYINFADGTDETINYTPDSTLTGGAVFSNGNNTSRAYGNETGRFIGISNNAKRITSALFVVGDDDVADDGDTEQLSFIAPMTFLGADGKPFVPTAVVPEPSGLAVLGVTLGALVMRRRRGVS